jgi:hypothetical protein
MAKIKNWSKIKDSKVGRGADNRVKVWEHDKFGDKVTIRKTPSDIDHKYVVEFGTVGGGVRISEGDNLSVLETRAVKWMKDNPNSL